MTLDSSPAVGTSAVVSITSYDTVTVSTHSPVAVACVHYAIESFATAGLKSESSDPATGTHSFVLAGMLNDFDLYTETALKPGNLPAVNWGTNVLNFMLAIIRAMAGAGWQLVSSIKPTPMAKDALVFEDTGEYSHPNDFFAMWPHAFMQNPEYAELNFCGISLHPELVKAIELIITEAELQLQLKRKAVTIVESPVEYARSKEGHMVFSDLFSHPQHASLNHLIAYLVHGLQHLGFMSIGCSDQLDKLHLREPRDSVFNAMNYLPDRREMEVMPKEVVSSVWFFKASQAYGGMSAIVDSLSRSTDYSAFANDVACVSLESTSAVMVYGNTITLDRYKVDLIAGPASFKTVIDETIRASWPHGLRDGPTTHSGAMTKWKLKKGGMFAPAGKDDVQATRLFLDIIERASAAGWRHTTSSVIGGNVYQHFVPSTSTAGAGADAPSSLFAIEVVGKNQLHLTCSSATAAANAGAHDAIADMIVQVFVKQGITITKPAKSAAKVDGASQWTAASACGTTLALHSTASHGRMFVFTK
ncbi:hypothetical protein BC831DRAFT_453079 [Entophlyctis helioformis]|nr:hypothetical protein BC831DRAFT_453079 [Entophlyctis helioformis]